ncbi:conserved hypothetical protein [Ricinus communis]|uniref:Uncharacterized protein n=1 Tax=Ricinus communis TaxID=3988 RepID=B9RUF1_RICCO|nr:conserved hypothetical protein [Ricinus communis]
MVLEKTLVAIIIGMIILGVAVEAGVGTPGPAPAPNATSPNSFPSMIMGLLGFALSFFVLKFVA